MTSHSFGVWMFWKVMGLIEVLQRLKRKK